MARRTRTRTPKSVENITHEEEKRRNLPSAEHQTLMSDEETSPLQVAYKRRNRDLDPQLVWRGKVQCIYIDPPYGIRFNSNFQWSTTSRDVRDGNAAHITREPEQVKAYRDTWRDGIHSYLTYLRDRLTVARELLTESGSIFVQIGDENVHRVRALMDEIFGEDSYGSTIYFRTTGGLATSQLTRIGDYILWYSKSPDTTKHRRLFLEKAGPEAALSAYTSVETSRGIRRRMTVGERRGTTESTPNGRVFRIADLCGQGTSQRATPFEWHGIEYNPTANSHWKPSYPDGMMRIARADRVYGTSNRLNYIRFFDDYPVSPVNDVWQDTGHSGFSYEKQYVVQTNSKVIERCILMTTDPGDLVLDPTCGSGTTAYVAEQWGRRWITIDTSRVALALARARIMGARYPYYLLSDSPSGREKEADLAGREPSQQPTFGDIRQGFVYERVPHITLRDIANNSEIDVIWESCEERLAPLRQRLSAAIGCGEDGAGRATGRQPPATIPEWEIPRELPGEWPPEAVELHEEFWELRIARQKAIDDSIARNAQFEYLYDKPYEDRGKVRVAGPFTVESVSPHRMLEVDENDQVVDRVADPSGAYGTGYDFAQIILENLKTSGVQQAHRADRIQFDSLTPWPGRLVCAEGRYTQGSNGDAPQQRAAIFIGPEFGTVTRPDLVEAAREAAEAEFDVLIACAFNYEAHTTEFESLGRVRVLKARMNADLHMATDLKNTGSGNLFVIFGEPDIDILDAGDNQVQVRVNGVDVFHPQTGEVHSDGPDGIACWFIDTDYNEEAFFVRHAYFLGANDPYRSLKTTLKAEIDAEAWESLHSDISRPFERPESGRIAVKVINNLGDEVMKVFRVR